jgi:SPP1 family predicted phage head-tail adaptor
MNIGELSHRITIQAPIKTPDGMGGNSIVWTDIATVYAAISPLSARRKTEALQSGINATHDIKIRYRRPMKSSWRIAYQGRYFSISGIVDPKEEHQWLVITVMEAAA